MTKGSELAVAGVRKAYSARSRLKLLAVTLGLAAGAYLLTRHLDHVGRYLPYLVLLACPLMHVLHHRHRHG